MKRIFPLIIFLFSLVPAALADEGDTTIVRAHDATHINWWGAFDNKVLFPNDNRTWAKVLMVYTMGCPGGGCSEWDYTTQVEIEPNDVTSLSTDGPVEVARIITPYGGYYDATWNHPYYFDVTPYAPLLKDSVNIKLFFAGWQDGFTVTLDFIFIEGTPPANTIDIQQMYRSGPGGFLYGDANNPIEDNMVPVNVYIDNNAASAQLRATFSGHGFGNNAQNGNPENCAEFCDKWYSVNVGTDEVETQVVWNDDCGMNPLYHQSGTWLYNRAGWCPGEPTTTYKHELINDVVPGDSNAIDLNMEPYVYTGGSGFPINYIVDAHVITYGTPNAANDAAITEIMAPSNDPNYQRFNPACSDVVFELENHGSEPLTSVKVEYGSEGSQKYTYTWTGNLGFMEKETVTINTNGWELFHNATANRFELRILETNGVSDENAVGNEMVVNYEPTPEWPSEFFLWWATNSQVSETNWYIENSAGTVVYSMGSRDPGTNYKDTFNLDPGCYQFVLQDSDCDGLSFFANNDGVGFARLHKSDGTLELLRTFQADFGCELRQGFTVGYSVGEAEITDATEVSVYPNPSSGLFNLDLTLGMPVDVDVTVYSAVGQQVTQHRFAKSHSRNVQLDLTGQPAGIYFVNVKAGNRFFARKIVVR